MIYLNVIHDFQTPLKEMGLKICSMKSSVLLLVTFLSMMCHVNEDAQYIAM